MFGLFIAPPVFADFSNLALPPLGLWQLLVVSELYFGTVDVDSGYKVREKSLFVLLVPR